MEVTIVFIIITVVIIIIFNGVTTVILLNVSPGSSPLLYRSTLRLIFFKPYFVSGVFTRLFLPTAGITLAPSN